MTDLAIARIRRIHAEVEAKIDAVRTAEDGRALYTELVTRFAEEKANRFALSAIGLSSDDARALADKMINAEADIILETTFEVFGPGTANRALAGDLVEQMADAFYRRVRALSVSVEFAGHTL